MQCLLCLLGLLLISYWVSSYTYSMDTKLQYWTSMTVQVGISPWYWQYLFAIAISKMIYHITLAVFKRGSGCCTVDSFHTEFLYLAFAHSILNVSRCTEDVPSALCITDRILSCFKHPWQYWCVFLVTISRESFKLEFTKLSENDRPIFWGIENFVYKVCWFQNSAVVLPKTEGIERIRP